MQVVIFWLHLEKVILKLENDVVSGMNTDHCDVENLEYFCKVLGPRTENSAVE